MFAAACVCVLLMLSGSAHSQLAKNPASAAKPNPTPAASRCCSRCYPQTAPSATGVVIQTSAAGEAAKVSCETQIKDFIPLMQAALWPVLLAVVLLAWRGPITKLLTEGRISLQAGEISVKVIPPEEVSSIAEVPTPYEMRIG